MFVNPESGHKKGLKIYNKKVAPLFKLCGIHTDVVGMYTIDWGGGGGGWRAGINNIMGVNKKNEGKNFSFNKTSAYLKVEGSC